MAIHPNQLRSEPTKPTLDGIVRWIRQVFNTSTSVIGRAYVDGFTSADGGTVYQTTEVDIGDWDMDATASVNVAHGLTLSKIRYVDVIIRSDDDTARYSISHYNSAVSRNAQTALIDATNIVLAREATSTFDSVNYNATSYNRGYIKITHIP